jgi:phosphopantetheinyl transferase
MKLVTITNDASRITYGKVTEYGELLQNGSSKKEAERAIVLALFNELGFSKPRISYRESGQPYLENFPEKHISISHAEGWFAVGVSDQPIGIDVQSFRTRIGKGSSYFINENEQQFVNDDALLHLIWCAKEAFYKLLEGNIADLRKEVSIVQINLESATIQLTYLGKEVGLNFKQLEGAYLVHTL